jgi:eukaryotic-like serine/threonine-protein kinase
VEFGRYQVVRRIAAGGMGEVFLARDGDRFAIVKTLFQNLARQETWVAQFLDEARVVAKLRHPNVVAVEDIGIWNGTNYIAMEYIHGDNLARMQEKGPVPLDVAVSIVHDAALGLDHAHKKIDAYGEPLKIVHRDVSPQNIMVRVDGVAKVVDFGLAKYENKLTRTDRGLMKGKLQYMSPEQIDGSDVDGRADQFALGVVLWELLAGKPLFRGRSDIEIISAVATTTPPKLNNVAPELSALVERMLARDREARFPSLAECAKHLQPNHARTAQYLNEILGDEIQAKTR